MNEQPQGIKIKRRRSRAEIQQLVAEYEGSGLNRMAFCQQSGLSLSTLSRYQKRRQEQTGGDASEAKRWLAVEVSGSSARAGGERASGLVGCAPKRAADRGRPRLR